MPASRAGGEEHTMDEARVEPDEGCPFLVPGLGEPGAGRLPAYCRRPDGSVKIPSREELLALCPTAAYRDCAGYCRPRGW